jgi:hypothetical protein
MRVPVERLEGSGLRRTTMTQAIMTIERAVNELDAKSLKATRGVRLALGFGIVAAAYALIVVEGLHGVI